MKLINPEFQVSKSKNKKVIKVCFGTRSSGTPCITKKSWDIIVEQFLCGFQHQLINLNDRAELSWKRMNQIGLNLPRRANHQPPEYCYTFNCK